MSDAIQLTRKEKKANIYEASKEQGALRQGEIISNLHSYKVDIATMGTDEVSFTINDYPFAIIVSQDCDLDWDYKARQNLTSQKKLIPNVLFCEISAAVDIRHATGINSNIWEKIKVNKDERYQFLQKVDTNSDSLAENLPEFAIDFKRYFTVPTDELYYQIEQRRTAKRRCRLLSPYVEHLSNRFYYFQSRIALPEDHFSEPTSN